MKIKYKMFLLYLVITLLLIQFICVKWTCFNLPALPCLSWAKLIPPLSVMLFMGLVFLSRKYDYAWAAQTAYIWLGWAFLWFCLVMLVMALQLILLIFKISLPFTMLGLWVFSGSLALAGLSLFNGLSAPKMKHIEINSPALNAKSFKIAQISDSHLGAGLNPKRLQKAVDEINRFNPDIVVFTGDILEHTGKHEQAYIDIINQLKPVYGKFGVLGNHEYYGGVSYNLDMWQKAGIQPLLNNAVELEPLKIIGVNDIRTTRIKKEDFTDFLQKQTGPKFNLLLSHTPLYFDEAAANKVNLMLSGHTHNGQLWPFKYLTRLQFKNVYGLYELDGANIYVTSGMFYWGPPMRFLTNNEVPLITIKNEI